MNIFRRRKKSKNSSSKRSEKVETKHGNFKILNLLWIVLFFTLNGPGAVKGKEHVVQVKDFGAVADGKTDSGNAIRAAIEAAIEMGPGSEVVFDAGTYRIEAGKSKQYCFNIANANGLTIRGQGDETLFVITDPTNGGFHVAMSNGMTLRDFSVDYDPLPFTQGTVITIHRDSGCFDLELDRGYPSPDARNFHTAQEPYGKWGMIIDRATRRIKEGTPDHYMTPKWEHVSGRVWRFFPTQGYHRNNLRFMSKGDAFVQLARGHAGAVLLARQCEDLFIENVTVHASPSLVVGLVGNNKAIVVRALAARFPDDSDRLITANADGVHCQQNRAGPIIEQCYFEGMADDGINIYTPPNIVHEVRSPTELVVSAGCYLCEPGDQFQVVNPKTGSVRGRVTLKAMRREGRKLVFILEHPIEGVVGGKDKTDADTLYNLDACGAGFQIRGNHMNGNRRYGCLLRAGGGIVENNRFEDTTGGGVVMTNEPDWPEGPVPWGITVRGNTFLRGGLCQGYANSAQGAALVVKGMKLGQRLATGRGVRDIVIEDNEFIDRAGAAIFIGGTQGVVIRNNRMHASADTPMLRKIGAILLDRCGGIVLKSNEVNDPRPDTTSAVEILHGVDAGEAGVKITGLETRLAPGAKRVDDRR
jgi:parallel beta helix pectate lyase-like protein/pectate lyase-like protein